MTNETDSSEEVADRIVEVLATLMFAIAPERRQRAYNAIISLLKFSTDLREGRLYGTLDDTAHALCEKLTTPTKTLSACDADLVYAAVLGTRFLAAGLRSDSAARGRMQKHEQDFRWAMKHLGNGEDQ